MSKTKIALVVVIIIAAGTYYGFTKKEIPTAVAPTIPNESAKSEEVSEPPTAADEEIGKFVVTYTDEGFLPKEINVKAGETVVFKNKSTKSMWPASAMHPTHAVYPTTGGCLGSTFDACKGVLPGESWSFKFDIPGNWKYHDHLTPKFFGAIDVK